jgi:hypothetical protein
MSRVLRALGLALALAPACQQAPAVTTVGPDGGIVMSDDGRLTVAVPRGALADHVHITIGRSEDSGRVCYELGPHGVDFRVPVAVTLDAPVDYHWNVLAIGDAYRGRICERAS